jgi:hypothetical protein
MSAVTFFIGVALASMAWACYILDHPETPAVSHARAKQVVICIVLGWVTVLLLEGFGLFGPYAGPEPHM